MNVNYEYSGKFDWGRKPRSPAGTACSSPCTRLACTHARPARLGKIFPRSRRGLDTAEKSSHEQQALLEYTRTACSMFHGTWCGFDRRSSAVDRSSDYMHVLRPKSSRAEELLSLPVDLPKSSSTWALIRRALRPPGHRPESSQVAAPFGRRALGTPPGPSELPGLTEYGR